MRTTIPANNTCEKAIISMTLEDMQNLDPEARKQAHYDSLMTQALNIAHNTPDVRQERIDAIREQIANGTYEIDVHQIAASLIRENPALFEK